MELLITPLFQGLVLVSVITPGGKKEAGDGQDMGLGNTTVLDFIGDMIKNMIPANLVAMSHMKIRTTYDHGVQEEPVEGMNMLGIIL